MSLKPPSFSIGVEEEYLLVDRETRDLVTDPPHELLEECQKLLGEHATPEFLRSQVEVGTAVCHSIGEARAELQRSRAAVIEVADRFGCAPIAASTHPFANWENQRHTDKERYNELAEEMQGVARRLVTCGMHVHVAVEDEDLRIDMLGQLTYLLPHLLALSTSSPFWRGQDTGLYSYRLSVFDDLPRTGLPETFSSYAEFRRTVETLMHAGLIEDGTKVWWDARPSWRFPTIELRITDICTTLEDGLTIAALYRCWMRMLWRLRTDNKHWRRYSRFLIGENRWRAQRYSFDKGLVDFGNGEVVPYAELLEEILDLIRDDAEFFGCVREVEAARGILERGTSAHRQRATFSEAIAAGKSEQDAFVAVVDQLIEETRAGVMAPETVS